MALRSSDREASLSRPRIDPGAAGDRSDARALDGKPPGARRGRVVYLGPPEPTPIPARSRTKPAPTPPTPVPRIVTRPASRPRSGNAARPTHGTPRPFAFAAFAAHVRDVDSRRLELQRTLDDNERRIADIDRDNQRADRPLVGWFSRRAAEQNEARLNALVEEREALETALVALTIDANFESDGVARPLFARLSRRFDAMALPAAARADGAPCALSLIASPVPGLHLHHAQRRDMVLYPHFVAVANAAGSVDVHDIRQLFLSQRTTAHGCELLATLPNGFNEAYACGDATHCRDFLDGIATYIDALPALVTEPREDIAAAEAPPIRPQQAAASSPAPTASTPPSAIAAAAPAVPESPRTPAPPSRAEASPAREEQPAKPLPAPAIHAPTPVRTPAASSPEPLRTSAAPPRAEVSPTRPERSAVPPPTPAASTSSSRTAAAAPAKPAVAAPEPPRASPPPPRIEASPTRQEQSITPSPTRTIGTPTPVRAPAVPAAPAVSSPEPPRVSASPPRAVISATRQPVAATPSPAPAISTPAPVRPPAAPAVPTPSPRASTSPPPANGIAAEEQPRPGSTHTDDGTAHWSEPLSLRHIPTWRPEPRPATLRAVTPPAQVSTTPDAHDEPRPGKVSRRFFASRHPAHPSADTDQPPPHPATPVVLGLHRKPLQLALACCGAVVFVAAVTSPLLWRKEAVPEAPARTVAQQIVPPAAPPAAPAMPAIPAAPPAKAEPPPLPVTAEIGRPLSRTQVIQLQGQLKALGFDPGPADGIVGPRTVTAARAFQAANGQAVTGLIDSRLFDAVAAASGRITSR